MALRGVVVLRIITLGGGISTWALWFMLPRKRECFVVSWGGVMGGGEIGEVYVSPWCGGWMVEMAVERKVVAR